MKSNKAAVAIFDWWLASFRHLELFPMLTLTSKLIQHTREWYFVCIILVYWHIKVSFGELSSKFKMAATTIFDWWHPSTILKVLQCENEYQTIIQHTQKWYYVRIILRFKTSILPLITWLWNSRWLAPPSWIDQ